MTDKIADVPYIVFEETAVKQERANKRLWILCILLVLLLVITNGLWIWWESQWSVVDSTTITQTVRQESDKGDNQFIGGDYGKANSEDNNKYNPHKSSQK